MNYERTDERETSLVIDHSAGVFHISSNRISLARYLKKLALEYKLAIEESFGCVTLSNVPVQLLSKLRLATYSKTTVEPNTEVN